MEKRSTDPIPLDAFDWKIVLYVHWVQLENENTSLEMYTIPLNRWSIPIEFNLYFSFIPADYYYKSRKISYLPRNKVKFYFTIQCSITYLYILLTDSRIPLRYFIPILKCVISIAQQIKYETIVDINWFWTKDPLNYNVYAFTCSHCFQMTILFIVYSMVNYEHHMYIKIKLWFQ